MARHQQTRLRSLTIPLFVLAASAAAAEATRPSTQKPAEPPSVDKPLLAYWAFDEPAGAECLDSSGNRYDAVPSRPGNPAIGRVDGLTGGALEFTGRHRLHVAKIGRASCRERV